MTTVTDEQLMCDYNETNRSYPEAYTGIFWLNKKLTKELPVKGKFSGTDHYDQYGKKWDKDLGLDYFDPSKPSVIHIHGWSKGTIAMTSNNFNAISSNYTKVVAHDKWLPDWNVGIFRWEPFADDDDSSLCEGVWVPNPRKAEAKIHIKTNMQYRNSDGNGFSSLTTTSSLYNKSITEMFVDEYTKIFGLTTNKEVRLSSHSIGGQLALSATALLTTKGYTSIKRIELLDIFFCNGQNDEYTSKPKSSSALARENLATINPSPTPDVAVSWYQCTNLTDCDIVGSSNTEMKQRVSWQGIRLWYLDGYSQVTLQHSECISWYYNTKNIAKPLSTYTYTPPAWYGWTYKSAKYTKDNNVSNCALSANTDTQIIKQNMYLPKYWVQIYNDTWTINKNDDKMDVAGADGTNTTNVTDDSFWVISDSHCPDELKLYEYFTFSYSVGEVLEGADNLYTNT